MTVAQQLRELKSVKMALMTAIQDKGAAINESTPFSEYPAKILSIEELKPGQGSVTAEYTASSSVLDIITLPQGETYLAANSLMSMPIRELRLPEGFLRLGTNSLSACTLLKILALPNSLTTIDSGALNNTAITHLIIPVSVTSMAACLNGFKGDKLTVYAKVSLPVSFAYGSSLITAVLNKDINSIGDSAFYNCIKLAEINLEYIEYIGANCFQQCGVLKNINLTSLKTAASYSFYRCTLIENIIFGTVLQQIPGSFLTENQKLKSLIFPRTSNFAIATSAFTSCSAIEYIEINASSLAIATSSFNDCNSLKTVLIKAQTVPAISSNTSPIIGLTVTNKTIKIYVQDSLLESYKNATGWSQIDASCYYPLSSYAA